MNAATGEQYVPRHSPTERRRPLSIAGPTELRPRAPLEDGPVRLLEGGNGRRSVVEVTSPVADNPLYRAFRALRTLGVEIVHAEVRTASNKMIQKLHLVEFDGTALDSRRLSDVVATLSYTHRSTLQDNAPTAAEWSGAA